MPTLILLHIIAGVCLLLWGLKLLRLGVTRGFGQILRKVLSASTKNRLLALLAGIGVTTFLQSSTATALIVSSFAGQGMMTATAGLAMVLGADIGTTLVAQLLTFDLSWLAPGALIIGYVLFSFDKKSSLKNMGRILVGLSLMLYALVLIKEGAQPLRDSEILPIILAPLERDPVFAIALAALMTWLSHSSLAMVLMFVSFVASGLISPALGLMLVLGANLGGPIAPFLATLRDPVQARWITTSNILIRMAGVLLILPVLSYVPDLLQPLSPTPERLLVNFHTAFNLALAALFLPFCGLIIKFVAKFAPEQRGVADAKRIKYLDEKALDTPSIALSGAMRETLRMADTVEAMLKNTIEVLDNNDSLLIEEIRQEDDVLDTIYSAIKRYMAQLTQQFMNEKESEQYMQILNFATNLEHVGDVIDQNLMLLARKKAQAHKSFSPEGMKELRHIHGIVLKNVQLAHSVFVSNDIDLARQMLKSKEELRRAEQVAYSAHFDRLREAVPETIATSSMHLDVIRDYRRISSYVCSVAYGILERAGELHETRLKPV